jgi:hypothetical protein
MIASASGDYLDVSVIEKEKSGELLRAGIAKICSICLFLLIGHE